ncbi:uncharacterized protein SPPG_08261 [Spizellomyces punctatus DAOM BR117]|uniref:60S acidic ribosomal protein P1 n=1 Tax=Spizellomyces punctatus (strain DAOM BR117) TaxID=645134 RepID=A0A0L0H618_SPIPD|nr:uncharacterized protein SPPG_08261 [Spizellomyces punctatus DAOM BR117]KNC96361.1 hypothetical protein SPPG_08261 [Spizellomyces punctatus DAOM BR117]|eukprot:XP_016604401.1 hypothetical protein SPPG_08261 [Spizellomyces punctatus DAOM BR117]
MSFNLSTAEASCVYASLLLLDANKPTENLEALLESAHIQIDPIWPETFAKALRVKPTDELKAFMDKAVLGAVRSGGGEAHGVKGEEEKKPEEQKKEPEVEEESDEDMGFGLFD